MFLFLPSNGTKLVTASNNTNNKLTSCVFGSYLDVNFFPFVPVVDFQGAVFDDTPAAEGDFADTSGASDTAAGTAEAASEGGRVVARAVSQSSMASVDLETPQKRRPPPRPQSPSSTTSISVTPVGSPSSDASPSAVSPLSQAAAVATPQIPAVQEQTGGDALAPPSDSDSSASALDERRRLSVMLAKADDALAAAEVAVVAGGGGADDVVEHLVAPGWSR